MLKIVLVTELDEFEHLEVSYYHLLPNIKNEN